MVLWTANGNLTTSTRMAMPNYVKTQMYKNVPVLPFGKERQRTTVNAQQSSAQAQTNVQHKCYVESQGRLRWKTTDVFTLHTVVRSHLRLHFFLRLSSDALNVFILTRASTMPAFTAGRIISFLTHFKLYLEKKLVVSGTSFRKRNETPGISTK